MTNQNLSAVIIESPYCPGIPTEYLYCEPAYEAYASRMAAEDDDMAETLRAVEIAAGLSWS